jgi:exopolysaccharide production protein ExoY
VTYQTRMPFAAELASASPVAPYAIPAAGLYGRFFKPLFDIVLVLLAAIPVLVMVLPLALVVALDGHSPFYMQERIGKNGRTFRMIKLRTMVYDADRVLEDYLDSNPAARAEWDRTQKLRNDPRVTFVGCILRKTSLDEVPQLWNVLIGDMSIVGPRPMMLSQQDLYPGVEYYAMRPGITGFWQISVRNDSSFAERAAFDRAYFRNLSFVTDFWVMVRTVRVVVKGTGY